MGKRLAASACQRRYIPEWGGGWGGRAMRGVAKNASRSARPLGGETPSHPPNAVNVPMKAGRLAWPSEGYGSVWRKVARWWEWKAKMVREMGRPSAWRGSSVTRGSRRA